MLYIFVLRRLRKQLQGDSQRGLINSPQPGLNMGSIFPQVLNLQHIIIQSYWSIHSKLSCGLQHKSQGPRPAHLWLRFTTPWNIKRIFHISALWPAKHTPFEAVIAYTKSQMAVQTNYLDQDGPHWVEEIV